jgi:hypothetical protein
MKRAMISLFLVVLLVGMAGIAIAEENTNETNESNARRGLGRTIRNRVKAGVYTGPEGERIRVSVLARNRTLLRVNGIEAETELEIEKTNETETGSSIFKVKLSNGRKSQIKIMPSVASATAIQRLRLKNCNESDNCTIELKEVGNRNQTRAVYETRAQKKFKVFGLFKARGEVFMQIDAETGEEVKTKGPWWAWLASESD